MNQSEIMLSIDTAVILLILTTISFLFSITRETRLAK